MEGCGLTDIGANLILDCLELNTAITEFNVRNNEGISKFLQRSIHDRLGCLPEEKQEPEYDLSCVNGLQSLPKNKKVTVSQLLSHTKALEEQLSFERTLRKKAEKLNEKLSHQLMRPDSNHMVQEKAMEGGSQTNISREYVARNDVMPEVIKKWASSQFSIQCLSDLSISSQFPKLPPVALQPAGQQCGHQSRSHTPQRDCHIAQGAAAATSTTPTNGGQASFLGAANPKSARRAEKGGLGRGGRGGGGGGGTAGGGKSIRVGAAERGATALRTANAGPTQTSPGAQGSQ